MARSKPRALPRSLSLVALAVVGIPGLLGAVAYFDHVSRPDLDFEPVRMPSALDRDGPSWPLAASAGDACADPAPALPERWIVVGWDGADWQFLLPLLRDGKLPYLQSLLDSGAYGTLASIVPTLSPAIWTTVATGRDPGDHEILHFYNQRPILERWWQRLTHFGDLDRQLYTNADRRKRAVWNLMTEQDRSVLTVGYHNTFPVEEVDGVMVSNYLAQDSVARTMDMESGGEADSDLAAGLVHPADQLPVLLEIQRQVNARVPEILDRFAAIPAAERNDFLRASRRLDRDGDQKPYFLVHAWVFDAIAAEIAETYLDRVRPDLAMVHFQAVDWASHHFLYYHSPDAFADMDWPTEVRAKLDADRLRYRDTVNSFYVFLDRRLGRLLQYRDGSTGILLLSDHGFDPEDDPDVSGGHDHAPPGILVLEGPGIRPGKIDDATVYDILPTLMAAMGLPIAEDLPGTPLVDAYCRQAYDPQAQVTVASYGDGTPFVPDLSKPADLDQELMQQLKSLGYLD